MDAGLRAAALACCAIPGAAIAQTPQASDIVAAFRAVCAAGETSQQAELDRADALGWRSFGQDAPKGFDRRTQRLSPSGGPSLILTTATDASAGEIRDSCGISSLTPVEGLVGATQRWLGFGPNFAMALSATFFGLRDGDQWRPSPKLDPDALAAVKHGGRLYSFMVLDNGAVPKDGGYTASLALLRVKTVP